MERPSALDAEFVHGASRLFVVHPGTSALVEPRGGVAHCGRPWLRGDVRWL